MRIKALVAAMVAALAIVGAAAQGAQANGFAPKGLELSDQGAAVPAGATVENELLVIDGVCKDEALGQVLDNGQLVDVVALGAPIFTECQPGASVSGGIQYVALATTGQALLIALPPVQLTTPSGCVYDFALLEGHFPIGGPFGVTFITGTAIGLLNGFGHKTSCERTLTTEFEVAIQGKDFLDLGTELVALPSHFALGASLSGKPLRLAGRLERKAR